MVRSKVAFVGPLERVLSLRSLPLLEHLSADDLTAIAQHARERAFPKGSCLIDPRKPTTAAYVVLDGQVMLRRPQGVEVVKSNESVGFLDLLARSATGLEAIADLDTQTLELDWEAQLDVCEQHFTILLQYIRYLCERGTQLVPLASSDTSMHRENGFVNLKRPLNIVERALAFGESPVFASCSPDALWELMRHVEEITFEQGDTIWDIGASAHSFLLTVNGAVHCENANGTTYVVEAGSTLGMYEAMSTQTRSYRAITTKPTTVLSLDDDSFLDILEDHFDMAVEYTAAIARRILDAGPAQGKPY